ncbi:hypothetical protein [Streptomyces sp. enrichment culture]|uniref:hypothetical protein n=1 Tax=Streptomyces sp. enrichment culture TaxID=1795815 RepID=UPI003F570A97
MRSSPRLAEGEAYEQCISGQYNCTYGRSTGDVKKVTFGKNYKKETKARGGTISPNYTIQQNTNYRHVYTKGKGVTRPTTAQRARSAQIEKQNRHEQERKAADDRRKKAEKQDNKNKQDEGFFAKLRSGDISGAAGRGWSNTKSVVRTVARAAGDHFSDHWRDYLGNGLLIAGAAGVLVCVASVVCGAAGLVAIGATSAGASYAAFNAGTKNWNTTGFLMSTATGGVTGYMGGSSAVASRVASTMSLWRLERSLRRIEGSVGRMRNFE